MKNYLCVMLIFAILALVQSVEVVRSSQPECSKNPADWCKSITQAKACNVLEQCRKNVWSEKKVASSYPPLDPDAVNLTLYFESECPPCKMFISSMLSKAFKAIPTILNVTLVPYGNAKQTWNETSQMWDFDCQHGDDECWGNNLDTCVLYYYPKYEDHFPFFRCLESNIIDDIHKAAAKCAPKFKISLDQMQACIDSKLGNDLQHQMGLLTEALDPPHKYVPWITINGQHTDDMQKKAQLNLIPFICDTYAGKNIPPACNNLEEIDSCPNENF